MCFRIALVHIFIGANEGCDKLKNLMANKDNSNKFTITPQQSNGVITAL